MKPNLLEMLTQQKRLNPESKPEKVVRSLERQIRSRKRRRQDKRKTNVQLGLLPGRSRLGVAGARA